jgi:uncharacterized membrane protein YkvA (DUF1232 family)
MRLTEMGSVIATIIHTIPKDTWNHQILTLLAFMCNSLLWFRFLTIDWAVCTTICTSGLLYLALPFDLIPARISRFGYADNILAMAVSCYGFHMMVQADQLDPMPDIVRDFLDRATTYDDFTFHNMFLPVSILIIILSTSVRYSLIGLEVIVGIPLLAFSYFQPPYGMAISFIAFGVFREPLKPALDTFAIRDMFPFTAHSWLAGLALWSYALCMEIPYRL